MGFGIKFRKISGEGAGADASHAGVHSGVLDGEIARDDLDFEALFTRSEDKFLYAIIGSLAVIRKDYLDI